MKTSIPPLLIALSLVWFALAARAQAVTPPLDGGYAGWNTAEGQDALFNLTTGGFNTAIGGHALYGNTTGISNTAVGAWSLAANSSGDQNVAIGQGTLRNNTTGPYNTAIGFYALYSNDGPANTATGFLALRSNTLGGENTANGVGALQNNRHGSDNAATGVQSLYNNTFGDFNTANGAFALRANTKGNNNTAIGEAALLNNTTGHNNAAFGIDAGLSVTTASNVTCIGASVAGADVSNTTWIGNVYGVTTQSSTTAPVVVSDTGQLGTVASSERFKKDIANMDKSSEAILSLRPVTFHYKTDTKDTPQFGLIAEEVAKVNPALVLPDKEGKPFTVRYDQVNAMLLNEFLKEHRKIEEQNIKIQQEEATISQLTSTVAQQQKDFQGTVVQLIARLDRQAAQIQNVSEHFEVNRQPPQVASNNW
jgi:hypothetical protein